MDESLYTKTGKDQAKEHEQLIEGCSISQADSVLLPFVIKLT